MKTNKVYSLILFVLMFCSSITFANSPEVIKVTFKSDGSNSYTFHVSVLHHDEGWDHYANKWEVLDGEGKLLGERVLLHPHENEQPFTRSQYGIKIPAGTTSVWVRAHDSVHGYGESVEVQLK